VPLALLAAGASLLSPSGRHQWALSLFRQPARYTVLAFDRPSALPTPASVNAAITVSFMVGNHEGHEVTYRYVLTSGGRRSRILAESTRAVAAGATWTVSAMVRPRCDVSPCRIKVALPGHPETIDFLVTSPDRGA